MKHLSDHPETRAELGKWAGRWTTTPYSEMCCRADMLSLAGGRKLVFANFFFWRPGSALQKSLSGLYRCLLHDVLEASPGLMPDVLPALWQQAKATPWQVQTEFDVPNREIRAAFARVIKSKNLCAEHCFCFFINGLDEYQETAQWDHKELVQLMCGWTRASPRDIKLCVSSRQHNVFMNEFAPELRLRLHELTRHDMMA
jgi:hypothetical protein